MKGLKNHDREFSALSAFCKEEMNICAILYHSDNVFCCDLQYVQTRKSNPFHGFLNGLTQPFYSVFQSYTFHPWRISQLFLLSICWWMKPSLFCVHILTPPFRYPLRYDLLPQELFNLQAPQHRPHPHNSRPIPFLRTSAHKANLIWEIPLGCPISRSGDIVLYLICLSPTAS